MSYAKTILVIGAHSDIARAAARTYAAHGWNVILAARDSARLIPDVNDLQLRYNVAARSVDIDVLDAGGNARFLDSLGNLPDTVLCAVGLLGEQDQSASDAAIADIVMRTNFNGPALLLGEVANRMEARGAGCIIGISSVAGDRGRATNYIYGAAKAGFTAFLSGLRNRLAKKGVHVITVKPGFVATRMTAGMDLPARLTAQPQEAGDAIYAAETKNRDVIYVRSIWQIIMLIIVHLPEFIFKRMKL